MGGNRILKFGAFKTNTFIVYSINANCWGEAKYVIAFIDPVTNRLDASINHEIVTRNFVGITALENDNSLVLVYYRDDGGCDNGACLVVEKLTVDADFNLQLFAHRLISPWESRHSGTSYNFYELQGECVVMWGDTNNNETFTKATFSADDVTPSADLLPCLQDDVALEGADMGMGCLANYYLMGKDTQLQSSAVGFNSNGIGIDVIICESGMACVHISTESPFPHMYDAVTILPSVLIDLRYYEENVYFLIECEISYKPDALHLKSRTVLYLVSTIDRSKVFDSCVIDGDKQDCYAIDFRSSAGARIMLEPKGVDGIKYY
jgi:hypothetical protein